MRVFLRPWMAFIGFCLLASSSVVAWGAEADKAVADKSANKADDKVAAKQHIKFADGKLQLTAPEGWKRAKPQNAIIEHEFAVPAAEGDERGGRVTLMGAGGTVDANIERWFGQFTQPDGGDTKDKYKEKTKKLEIAGLQVHVVDMGGTYKDSQGPFNPAAAVEREKYRMLAAVITSPKLGNYFVKFYGPERTVSENAKAFDAMIRGLQKN